MYGKEDLRLEEFELPPLGDDEILARVVSDSICMSSYKAAKQGGDHKRVPSDVEKNPVIIGHEFCGELVKIGEKWKENLKEYEVLYPAAHSIREPARARVFVQLYRQPTYVNAQ